MKATGVRLAANATAIDAEAARDDQVQLHDVFRCRHVLHDAGCRECPTGERNGQSFTFSSIETWTLGDGGKSLTVTAVRSSQQGEVTTKAAYDKQ